MWRRNGLPNDRHNAGRPRKSQQGSGVQQVRIGSRGEVEIGRWEACAAAENGWDTGNCGGGLGFHSVGFETR